MLTSKKFNEFTDNQIIGFACYSGATVSPLFCAQNNPGMPMDSSTRTVDSISRIVDLHDWKVNPKLFRILDSKWGPHSLHCLASPHNTQLAHFIALLVAWRGSH